MSSDQSDVYRLYLRLGLDSADYVSVPMRHLPSKAVERVISDPAKRAAVLRAQLLERHRSR